MTKIRFTGEAYNSVKFSAPSPGEYEVDDKRAEYLTTTFPDQFEVVQDAPQTAQKASSEDEKKAEPVEKETPAQEAKAKRKADKGKSGKK